MIKVRDILPLIYTNDIRLLDKDECEICLIYQGQCIQETVGRGDILVKRRGRPSNSDLCSGVFGTGLRVEVLCRMRHEYFQNDKTMHLFLKPHIDELSVGEIRWLLDWSGDSRYWKVTKNKEIRARCKINEHVF